MQPNGNPTNNSDRLIWNYQKPHRMAQIGVFKLNTHWEQTNTDQIEWTIQYRIQTNDSAKTTVWTTVTANSTDDSTFVYPGSGTFNQITRLAEIDLSSYALSSTVQFRLTRTDTTSNDIDVTFVDAHFPMDSLGSNEESVKY